ncbi:hypothetical protein DL89DRAFT_286190 [Linderina pennispora]|uniref:Uncharacterized protein n=1 Tax=Linderina pennispora TaxID=61395 RepID=A0A1Y1VZK3_9FUNG|nr:uncharacterized protein DL89DRAFT_286190 [Linderina pennispora]ORX66455.1 hypothetical protein DL89DRAFT_286190 [Linderina pennispora]
MSFTQLTVSRPAFVGDGSNSGDSAKRVKLEFPTKARTERNSVVLLQPVSVVIPHGMQPEDAAGLVRMCQWNQELSAMVMHLQNRVAELRQAQQHAPGQMPSDSPMSSASTLAPTSPLNQQPDRPYQSLRHCDFKYGVRRIYILKLRATKANMAQKLSDIGIDSDWAVHVQFLTLSVVEAFVKAEFSKQFFDKLMEAGIQVLDGYEPMTKAHPGLTDGEATHIAASYGTVLRKTLKKLSAPTCSVEEKFLHYLREYAKEIGAPLKATVVQMQYLMLPSPSHSPDQLQHHADQSPHTVLPPKEFTVYRPRLSDFSSPQMSSPCASLEPVKVKIAPETPPEEAKEIAKMCEYNNELRLIAELLQKRITIYEQQQQQRNQQIQEYKAVNQETTPTNSDKASTQSRSLNPSPERHSYAKKDSCGVCTHGLPEPSPVEAKYAIRTLYIKGMRVFPYPYMDKVLRHYDIDDLEIYHVNYVLPDVCEIFVSQRDAEVLVRRLRRYDKAIFKGFHPLHISLRSKMSLETKKTEYRKRLLTSYHRCDNGNFRRLYDIDQGQGVCVLTDTRTAGMCICTSFVLCIVAWGLCYRKSASFFLHILPPADIFNHAATCYFTRRVEEHAHRVVLKTSPVQIMDLGTGGGPSQLAQWNDQPSSLLYGLQGELYLLLPMLPTGHLSSSTAPGPLSPFLLLGPSTDHVSDDCTEEFASCDQHLHPHSPLPSPLSRKLGTYTVDIRPSHTCRSDKRHSMHRIYTLGLMRPQNSSMRTQQRKMGIDSSYVVHSHNVVCGVNKFVVEASYGRMFVRHLNSIKGVKVIRFFDLLHPTYSELSPAQWAAPPGMYKQRVRTTFCDSKPSRPGFMAYARDYKREIGL